MREYNQKKKGNHTYTALNIDAKSFRTAGVNAVECDAAMQRLATSKDDYWYPSFRCLKTIDCVAKLKRKSNGRPYTIGLIQITKSDKHAFDSSAIDNYAQFFPSGCRYIALVPSKQISDNFRLDPANSAASVPLHVAYITTGAFDASTKKSNTWSLQQAPKYQFIFNV